jgi:hypothetical protein
MDLVDCDMGRYFYCTLGRSLSPCMSYLQLDAYRYILFYLRLDHPSVTDVYSFHRPYRALYVSFVTLRKVVSLLETSKNGPFPVLGLWEG